MGLVCPIVDSLSERRVDRGIELVTRAVQARDFRHLIVTSRTAPPSGAVWDSRRRITPAPICKGDVPLFIRTYAPDSTEAVAERIAPLVAMEPLPSPLFLRFAIEQATNKPLGSIDKVDLVLDYVEALRLDRVDLSRTDMLRAASVAAVESIRDDGVPREIERLHLRGVLRAEADRMPFMDTENAASVEPASIIDRLIEAGLLDDTLRGDRLQFVYDPVAEFLAARSLNQTEDLRVVLRGLLGSHGHSPIAQAYREFTRAVTPQPPKVQPNLGGLNRAGFPGGLNFWKDGVHGNEKDDEAIPG